MLLLKLYPTFFLIILLKINYSNQDLISLDVDEIFNKFNEQYGLKKETGCSISIHNDDITNPQPLLLNPDTEKFYEKITDGKVNLKTGENVELYCTKKFTTPFKNADKIIATCVNGKKFKANGKTYQFSNFQCNSEQLSIARRTGRKCNRDATEIEIGFELSNRFVRLYDVCHDEKLDATLYSHHYLSPRNSQHQTKVDRVQFQKGIFYKGRNVQKLYTQAQQQKTVKKILKTGSEKYFDIENDVYLARGHLNAKADYVFGPQQLATFYFINAAPQWQTFNAGNWLAVENGVKKFADKRKLNLEVYTGTWGIDSLPDSKGVLQELYMDYNENGEKRIPVPKLYYKIIIDNASKKGIVLIGVNNPHLKLAQIKKDYIICKDVSEKIDWLNWHKTDILHGYSYACDVNEFTKIVDHLPKLNVKGLLY